MFRILHLAKYYAPFRGGIETHVRSLAQAQAAAGHAITVACVNHQDHYGQDVWASRTARTSTVQEMDGEVRVRRFGKFATLARFDFCLGIRKYLAHCKGQFDIIHLHTPNPVMTLALAMTNPGIPIVVTYHSDIVKQRIIRKPFSVIEHAVFRKSSRVIAATQKYLDSSETLAHFRDRAVVIPYGLDLEPYTNPSCASLRFRDHLTSQHGDTPIWLTVGRLVYYKGTEYSVRALAKCPGHLIIVGRGPNEVSLRQLARQLGVTDRITFLQDLTEEQLIGAYHAATALWFPSIIRSEAFGLVQVEAMASGCPVINTDIEGSGSSWVSLHNESGWTVPIEDHESIAKVARELAMDRELHQQVSESARHRAETVFSINKMLIETENLYSTVVSGLAMSTRFVPINVGLSEPRMSSGIREPASHS